MANLDAFERVFRVEVQKKKDQGEQVPSWADVKRMVKAKRLFDEDDMQDPDFKAELKEKATELAIEIMSEEPEKDSHKPTKKRKANAKQDAPQERPAKRVKQAAPKASKKRVTSDVDSDVEMEVKPKMKAPSQKKPKPSKQTIDNIDDDDEEIPSRKSKQTKQREYSSAIDSDSGAVVPPKSPEAVENSLAEEKRISAAEVAEMSDSALSIVIDGTPAKVKKTKKERKKTEPKETKGGKKEKAGKDKTKGNTTDDPDEEQIKRLKGFVVACGVRKKWAKEFDGIEDKPKKQIARLKEILEGLGMSGRMSMEKAKAIRAKRELAEEIQEVVQFEARRGLPKDQEGAKSKRKQKESLPENNSEDEDDLAANPPMRKKNILAFLDDQSDSDEE